MYDIYVSMSGGPFELWLGLTTDTNAIFNAEPNRTYSFYSRAYDNALNREEAPLTPDATTTTQGSHWQNPVLAVDVDGDKKASPLDVLVLINYINTNGSGSLPSTLPSPPFYDVDGDTKISPLDVLIVINFLNSKGSGSGGEGESAQPQESINSSCTDMAIRELSWIDANEGLAFSDADSNPIRRSRRYSSAQKI